MTCVLHENSTTLKAILNHHDSSSMGHYAHHTFDTLCPIIQKHADWLFSLKATNQDVPLAQSMATPGETALVSVGQQAGGI